MDKYSGDTIQSTLMELANPTFQKVEVDATATFTMPLEISLKNLTEITYNRVFGRKN